MSAAHIGTTCAFPTCRESISIAVDLSLTTDMSMEFRKEIERKGWMFSHERDGARYYLCPMHAWEMDPIT